MHVRRTAPATGSRASTRLTPGKPRPQRRGFSSRVFPPGACSHPPLPFTARTYGEVGWFTRSRGAKKSRTRICAQSAPNVHFRGSPRLSSPREPTASDHGSVMPSLPPELTEGAFAIPCTIRTMPARTPGRHTWPRRSLPIPASTRASRRCSAPWRTDGRRRRRQPRRAAAQENSPRKARRARR